MEIPGAPLSLPSYFALPLESLGPRLTVQPDPSMLPSSSTKRPGEPLGTSPDNEKRTSQNQVESESEENLADFGLSSRNDDHIRVDITDEDQANAMGRPTLGIV